MTEHSVSIIIPAYRAAATISRALDSLLNQTRQPDQIIVIDDGSPDDLATAVAPYASQVIYIRQENAGASAARNKGIDAATGNLIAFLDADDYWEPTKLKEQIDILDLYPDVGLVASDYFTQTPREEKTSACAFDGKWVDRVVRPVGADVIEIGSLIWTCTVLIRRHALGIHRFVTGLEPAEDRDLWIRMLREHPAYVLSKPLATAVLEPDSLSRGCADFGYAPMIRVLHRHQDLLRPAELRGSEARVYRGWAAAHLAGGFGRSAFAPAFKRVARQPASPEAWWVLAKSAAVAVLHPGRKPKPRIVSADGRGEPSLRRHYKIEKELADRLRAASAKDRQSLYGQVYNELFRQVPDHPQNTRKADPAIQQALAQRQWRLLSHFVKGDSIYLEVGAGDCALTMQVAASARQAIAVDVSDVISTTASQPKNFTLLITDGVRMPVPAGSVNVAYSNQLMEHLHPDDAASQLAEIRRSLADSGVYICITPHRHSGPWDISKFFATEAHGFHLKEYTYRELHRLMLQAGFRSTGIWTGLKGHFFAVPQPIILAIESLISSLPRAWQKRLTRCALLRPVFTNVMIVGHAGQNSHAPAALSPDSANRMPSAACEVVR